MPPCISLLQTSCDPAHWESKKLRTMQLAKIVKHIWLWLACSALSLLYLLGSTQMCLHFVPADDEDLVLICMDVHLSFASRNMAKPCLAQ